ncbi:hypothetical protein C8R43DRAFT_480253 [Mycena crocata]|nr:hypothetical protein C8R43DRAFT_480253 [Mycena crocata]
MRESLNCTPVVRQPEELPAPASLRYREMRDKPPTPESPQWGTQCDRDSDRAVLPLPAPSAAPTDVLELDQKTPDAHVCRDARMIRLTGVHPFNAEAPLTALLEQGFLTPPELFFVRNHGPVPDVNDADVLDWEFTVEG